MLPWRWLLAGPSIIALMRRLLLVSVFTSTLGSWFQRNWGHSIQFFELKLKIMKYNTWFWAPEFLPLLYNCIQWTVSGIAPSARIFPIYFPIGNLATGFFVIFSLIASVVGVMTSLTGLQEVNQGRATSILSAASSSFVTWALTLLAMG
jgi:AWPM-19-like family